MSVGARKSVGGFGVFLVALLVVVVAVKAQVESTNDAVSTDECQRNLTSLFLFFLVFSFCF